MRSSNSEGLFLRLLLVASVVALAASACGKAADRSEETGGQGGDEEDRSARLTTTVSDPLQAVFYYNDPARSARVLVVLRATRGFVFDFNRGRWLPPLKLEKGYWAGVNAPFSRSGTPPDAAYYYTDPSTSTKQAHVIIGTKRYRYGYNAVKWFAPEDLTTAGRWGAANGPFAQSTEPVDGAFFRDDIRRLVVLRGKTRYMYDYNQGVWLTPVQNTWSGGANQPFGDPANTAADALYWRHEPNLGKKYIVVIVGDTRYRYDCNAGAWDAPARRIWRAPMAPYGPYVPTGFGTAGSHGYEQHDRWYYNWGLNPAGGAEEERGLPMVWGGPPNPDQANRPADCNAQNYGQSCWPGCANTGQPGCSDSDPTVMAYFDRIEAAASARPEKKNWLIFNEPDLWGVNASSYLDPVHAAWLYQRIHDRVRAIIPDVRFYCCGTAPGIGPGVQWMQTFAAHVNRPVDALAMHNYHPNWPSVDATVQVMIDFHHQMQALPPFAKKDILVTEWGALGSDTSAQFGLLEGVGRWLNQHADDYRYVGAAWFYAGYAGPDWQHLSFFDPEAFPTPLGEAFLRSGSFGTGYRWKHHPLAGSEDHAAPRRWTFDKQLVCKDGSQPTNPGATRLFYAKWPPNPLQWSYGPLGTGPGITTVQTVIEPEWRLQSVYLGLMTSNGWGDELQPIEPQATSSMDVGTWFNPPTWMVNQRGIDLPNGSYSLGFVAPDAFCAPAEPIGEVGLIDDSLTQNHKTVVLSRSYNDPVVILGPLSRDGGDTTVPRIVSVQSDRFTVYAQEAPNKDGGHTGESIAYLVVERGKWRLANGTRLVARTVDTDIVVHAGAPDNFAFKGAGYGYTFAETPALLATLQTHNGGDFVKPRIKGVYRGSFQVALEEWEGSTAHVTETIGYVAIQRALGRMSGRRYAAMRTGLRATHQWTEIPYHRYLVQPVRLFANLASWRDKDNAYLRYDSQRVFNRAAWVMIEEDTVKDTEVAHDTEYVSLFAIEGDGLLYGTAF